MKGTRSDWKDRHHAFVKGEDGGCMICGYGVWEPFHKVGLSDPEKMERALSFIRMVAAHEGEWRADAKDTLEALTGDTP